MENFLVRQLIFSRPEWKPAFAVLDSPECSEGERLLHNFRERGT